ncbi:MAG: hypothetical protein IPM37_23330 [Hahellaceae bacterium]|nr:hypothetical protein [Hahellaceae bacterium]
MKVGNLSNADGAFAIEIGSSNYRHGGIWLQANGGYTATGIHLAGFTTGIKSTASTTATGAYGVQGTSTLGTGVRGETYADNTAGYAGVVGIAFDGSDGTGVYGTGNGTAAKGVHGQTNTGLGVHGEATGSGTGVKGVATSGAGVKGEATTGIGVSAKATGSGGVPPQAPEVAGSTSGVTFTQYNWRVTQTRPISCSSRWHTGGCDRPPAVANLDQNHQRSLICNGGWRRFQCGRLTMVACIIMLSGCQSVYVAIGVHPPGLDVVEHFAPNRFGAVGAETIPFHKVIGFCE